MSTVAVARFKFLHEAEYAKGFLDDAGLRCWLKSEDAAGGAPYIGGLAGATLIVASDDAERSLEVLRVAGLVDDKEDDHALSDSGGDARLPPALRADLSDVERELTRARKAEVRHFVWAMFGVSPAAVLPLFGLALEGNLALVGLLCVMVVFVEGWRWVRARGEVKRLEGTLEELRKQIGAGTGEETPA